MLVKLYARIKSFIVTRVFAKSADSNSLITQLFQSRIANFPKALLLVSLARIQ